MNDPRSDHATDRFTGLAGVYAAHRPTYPRAAIVAMLDGLAQPVCAADIGCGTGISTRLLGAEGCIAVGVDPNADMLAQAALQRADGARADAAPGSIRWSAGTAEATGLADSSVDLVLCAQAFHWFEPDAALREFSRILRLGGRVALLWNIRGGDDPFTREYDRIIRGAADKIDPSCRAAREMLDGPLWSSTLFAHQRRLAFPSPQVLDEAGLVGRAQSASYFPMAEPLRSELTAELRAAFARFAVDGRATLMQTAQLTLAERV